MASAAQFGPLATFGPLVPVPFSADWMSALAMQLLGKYRPTENSTGL